MSMTKKDYELIADTIRRNIEDGGELTIAYWLAETLSKDNAKFDQNRFLTLCGIKTADTTGLFYNKCDECGRGHNDGICVSAQAGYCSLKCAGFDSEAEWLAYYEEQGGDEGDMFWTDWEEFSDNVGYTAEGDEVEL